MWHVGAPNGWDECVEDPDQVTILSMHRVSLSSRHDILYPPMETMIHRGEGSGLETDWQARSVGLFGRWVVWWCCGCAPQCLKPPASFRFEGRVGGFGEWVTG